MISVIIPTYNYSAYIADAIDSVLNQSYAPIEIIVIDDGSTDQTAQIVAGYNDKVIYCLQNNLGASAARNLGVNMARGEFLAFLDADDIWEHHKLAVQMEAFNREPSPDMMFSAIKNFYSPDCNESLKQRLLCPESIMPGFNPTTLLIQKKTFLEVGFFDTSISTGEFIDWYMRAQKKGLTSHLVDTVLAHRRVHSGHLGKSKTHQNYCQILRRALART